LKQRRDKIGKTYFSRVLPLDSFRVSNGELLFDDLAVQHKFSPTRKYRISWWKFDNEQGTLAALHEDSSSRLPGRFSSLPEGDYVAAKINASGDERKTVTVFLRKKGATAEVVGLEREW